MYLELLDKKRKTVVLVNVITVKEMAICWLLILFDDFYVLDVFETLNIENLFNFNLVAATFVLEKQQQTMQIQTQRITVQSIKLMHNNLF